MYRNQNFNHIFFLVRNYIMIFCFQSEVELDIEEYANKILLKIKNFKNFSHDLEVCILTRIHFVSGRPFSPSSLCYNITK